MTSFRLLRLGLSLASVSALFIATACGGSDGGSGGGGGGSGDCTGSAPSCGVITGCGVNGGGETEATCNDGQWECPVYNGISCPEGDAGYTCSSDIAIDCGTCNGEPVGQQCGPEGWTCPPLAPSCGDDDSDGGACPDVEPLCGDCGDGSYTEPVCSGSEWICPILNCPYQGDGGYDGGGYDGGHPDGGGYDGGGYDGGVDAAPDSGFDAGGDLCQEGAACTDGMSCTIGSAGQVPQSCECIDGEYACVP